tara:strand:+ start:135 stop:518 length:384 start_codon:yes stop_codon:yes gene_type:complete
LPKSHQTLEIDPDLEEIIRESRLTPDKAVWLEATMDDLPANIVKSWDAYVVAYNLMTEAKAEVKELVTTAIRATGEDKLFAPKELIVKFSAPFTKAPELGWGYVPAKPQKAGKPKRTFSIGGKRKAG